MKGVRNPTRVHCVVWISFLSKPGRTGRGRIQGFHLRGGGGAQKIICPHSTLRARNRTYMYFRLWSKVRYRGPGSSWVVLMLSRAIWALFFTHSEYKKKMDLKNIIDPIVGGRLLRGNHKKYPNFFVITEPNRMGLVIYFYIPKRKNFKSYWCWNDNRYIHVVVYQNESKVNSATFYIVIGAHRRVCKSWRAVGLSDLCDPSPTNRRQQHELSHPPLRKLRHHEIRSVTHLICE